MTEGDASPHRDCASPHRDLGVPHSDLSAGWSEVKDLQNPIQDSTKLRGNCDSEEKHLRFWLNLFLGGSSPNFGEKALTLSAKTFIFFGLCSISFTELRNLH